MRKELVKKLWKVTYDKQKLFCFFQENSLKMQTNLTILENFPFFLTYLIPQTFEMISPIRHFCMSVVVVGPLILIKILQLSEIWKPCSADGQFQLFTQMFKRIKIHTHRGTLEFLFLAVLGCFGYHPIGRFVTCDWDQTFWHDGAPFTPGCQLQQSKPRP